MRETYRIGAHSASALGCNQQRIPVRCPVQVKDTASTGTQVTLNGKAAACEQPALYQGRHIATLVALGQQNKSQIVTLRYWHINKRQYYGGEPPSRLLQGPVFITYSACQTLKSEAIAGRQHLLNLLMCLEAADTSATPTNGNQATHQP